MIEKNPTKPKKLKRRFEELDDIDMEIVEYMTSFENYAARPPPNGIHEWSLILEQTRKVIA